MVAKIEEKVHDIRPRRRERGDGMVGYLIVLALVVLACVTAATNLGTSVKDLFQRNQDKIDTVQP